MPFEDSGSEGSTPPDKGRKKPSPLFGDRPGGAERASTFHDAEGMLRSLCERWFGSTGVAKEQAAAEFARLTNGASIEQVLSEQGFVHPDEQRAAEGESDQQTRAALEGMGIKVGRVTSSSSREEPKASGRKKSKKGQQIVKLIMERAKATDPKELAEIETLLKGLTGTDWSGQENPSVLTAPPEFGPHQRVRLVGSAWLVEDREPGHSDAEASQPPRKLFGGVTPSQPESPASVSPKVVEVPQESPSPESVVSVSDTPSVGEALGALGRAVANKMQVPGSSVGKTQDGFIMRYGTEVFLWVALAFAMLKYTLMGWAYNAYVESEDPFGGGEGSAHSVTYAVGGFCSLVIWTCILAAAGLTIYRVKRLPKKV